MPVLSTFKPFSAGNIHIKTQSNIQNCPTENNANLPKRIKYLVWDLLPLGKFHRAPHIFDVMIQLPSRKTKSSDTVLDSIVDHQLWFRDLGLSDGQTQLEKNQYYVSHTS